MVVPAQFHENAPIGVVLPDILDATVTETARYVERARGDAAPLRGD